MTTTWINTAAPGFRRDALAFVAPFASMEVDKAVDHGKLAGISSRNLEYDWHANAYLLVLIIRGERWEYPLRMPEAPPAGGSHSDVNMWLDKVADEIKRVVALAADEAEARR